MGEICNSENLQLTVAQDSVFITWEDWTDHTVDNHQDQGCFMVPANYYSICIASVWFNNDVNC
jgi:hypothetical protein